MEKYNKKELAFYNTLKNSQNKTNNLSVLLEDINHDFYINVKKNPNDLNKKEIFPKVCDLVLVNGSRFLSPIDEIEIIRKEIINIVNFLCKLEQDKFIESCIPDANVESEAVIGPHALSLQEDYNTHTPTNKDTVPEAIDKDLEELFFEIFDPEREIPEADDVQHFVCLTHFSEEIRKKIAKFTFMPFQILDSFVSLSDDVFQADVKEEEKKEEPSVAIITAVKNEIKALQRLTGKGEKIYMLEDHFEYIVNNPLDPQGKKILIANLKKMGNVDVAIACTRILDYYKSVSHVIMCGVAGGIKNSNLNLGDIVIADKVIKYDYGHNYKNGFMPKELTVNSYHIKIGENEDDIFWRNLLKEKATGDFAQPSTSNISSPNVHRGNIGTADSVLMNAEIGEEINEKFRIIAVDMEGYAIGRSATLLHVDFNIIRGISDFSDENKNTDWQKYAALAAASYTLYVVYSLK